MSSILTNNGAMVALQTLRGINNKMEMTQNEISTGKSVATAKDNAAVWAISKVMESDVKGFDSISDSLNLGESTVSVARNASEAMTDLLTEIKGKIVNSQESNVDRGKIQSDITKLTDQIKAVVGAAQFNGLNLVNGKSANPVQILSSLDRDSSGGVTATKIDVATVNLGTAAGDALTGQTVAASLTGAGSGPYAAASEDFTLALGDASGTAAGVTSTSDAVVDRPTTGTPTTAGMYAGDTMLVTIGDKELSYILKAGDTTTEIAAGLNAAAASAGFTVETGGPTADTDSIKFGVGGSGELQINNYSATSRGALGVDVRRDRGQLADLEAVDVTTDAGAADALSKVEGMIESAIEAAASFGSVQKRIEIQSDFVSKLTDALTSGIGSMVDADMEETSARLQALQVQQQLGTQSLSIANKAPQSLLSLFR